MALWELDAFQGPAFLGFVRNVPTPFPFISNRWLPDRRVPDIDVSYIKGSMQRPVMAHLVGFDSEAPIGGRQPLGTRVQLDLTPIKRKYRIGEKELIRFYQPRANSADVQVAIDEVFNLTRQGLDSIQARAEWLKMQALSQDTVVYDEAGVVMSFDYGITNAYQIDLPNQTDGASVSIASAVGPVWSDTANSTPIADLAYICNKMQDETGFRPETMVCSRLVVSYMLQSASIRTLVRGSAGATAQLTRGELETVLTINGLPSIQEYDVIVNSENADGTFTAVRPLAQTRAVLLPPSSVELGNMLWGPTAESRSLIGTSVANEAPGLIAVTYGQNDPPSEWVKCVGLGFPSLPGAEFVGQIIVAAES